MDTEDGAADLNTLTCISISVGGIIGCAVAGAIELNQVWYHKGGEAVDPNLFFAVYTCLIMALTISVARLSYDLEPEMILERR